VFSLANWPSSEGGKRIRGGVRRKIYFPRRRRHGAVVVGRERREPLIHRLLLEASRTQ